MQYLFNLAIISLYRLYLFQSIQFQAANSLLFVVFLHFFFSFQLPLMRADATQYITDIFFPLNVCYLPEKHKYLGQTQLIVVLHRV